MDNAEEGDGYKFRESGIIKLTGCKKDSDLKEFYHENYDKNLTLRIIQTQFQMTWKLQLSVLYGFLKRK